MSRLDELIEELCPDGVEYKQIKDIAWTGIGLATSVTKYKRDKGVVLIHNSDIKQNKIELKNYGSYGGCWNKCGHRRSVCRKYWVYYYYYKN